MLRLDRDACSSKGDFMQRVTISSLLILSLLFIALPAFGGAIAFSPPGGLATNGPPSVNLGMVFTANTSITVTALGFFDLSGLFAGETVGIFNTSGQLLASTNVQLSDPLVGGYFFRNITPLNLTAGNTYVVVALTGNNPWSYSSANPIVNIPSITYLNSAYIYSTNLQFPIYNYPASYYGPNFLVPEHISSFTLLGSSIGVLLLVLLRKRTLLLGRS